ncbi:hypothetical protein BV22DRAFT_1100087 [Leucogyrophana mollusca]|uniref:Uncharacterized protein n=1 Tax=Leucogyrophana mollusca TaxID=85980 RepID=A0ACB8B0V2_9AGAM|nr:hypothetical protein BV22DRAFT_1100087 [Leucogyrophana mollusca]
MLPTQISHTEGKAPSGHPDTPEGPDARSGPQRTLSRFWARLRGTKPRPTELREMQPPAVQHSPTPSPHGSNAAAGRAFTRLMAAPDRLEDLVAPPPQVQVDDVPPSPSSVGTYEIVEDLRNYRPPWLYRFCYALCYPRDTRYVIS